MFIVMFFIVQIFSVLLFVFFVNIENSVLVNVLYIQLVVYCVVFVVWQVLLFVLGFNVVVIELMVQQFIYGECVFGMVVVIVQGGCVFSVWGYGVIDVNNLQQVDVYIVFCFVLLFKVFVGMMVGLLVNDGILCWDSKVIDYVFGFWLNLLEVIEWLIVVDLFSYWVGLFYNVYDCDVEVNVEYYMLIYKLVLILFKCQLGECYVYQNVVFSLIGDVVYVVFGSFYEQLVECWLFKLLGMDDVSFGLVGIQVSLCWVCLYVCSCNGWVVLIFKFIYYWLVLVVGVNVSVSDMVQWLLVYIGYWFDVLFVLLLVILYFILISILGEMCFGWCCECLYLVGYVLGWCNFDYVGYEVVFYVGVVQGYCGLVVLVLECDFGIVIMWNGESSLFSGLLLIVFDVVMGLFSQCWLDVDIDFGSDNLMVEDVVLQNKCKGVLFNCVVVLLY